MIDHEIDRIAAAIHQLRPDWPTASLRTLLGNPALRDRPRRDIAVALAWVACEPTSLTPARVLEAGPWWRAAAVEHPEGVVRHPPRKGADDECDEHVGEYRSSCRACASNQLAADAPPSPIRRPANDEDRARSAEIRAGLRDRLNRAAQKPSEPRPREVPTPTEALKGAHRPFSGQEEASQENVTPNFTESELPA